MRAMESWSSWLSVAGGALLIGSYELYLAVRARRDPDATARSAHRGLRAEWVRALSRQPGSELLAVQTLRNSLMSATITASTAAISAMGASSLLFSKSGFELAWSPRVVLELLAVSALFAAYVCSAIAARYYHHSSFLMSLPVGSAERTGREPTATAYVQRAGVLYGWSLRSFLFLMPILMGIVDPRLTLPAALLLIRGLYMFDAAPDRTSP